MHPAGDPAALRPLSLGEIFDRALTLYVQNFALFTLIELVVVLPLGIAQYFIGLHESSSFAQIIAQIQHPRSAPAPTSVGATGWPLLIVVLAVVLNAFSIVAIAFAVARTYRGEPADWRASYAHALRRAPAILITLLTEGAAFMLTVFAGAFAMTAVFFVAFLSVRASPAIGVVAFIAGLLVGLVWFLGIVLCYLAFGFAFNAIGVEQAAIAGAIVSGFARIFNRSELLRAIVVCLALAVIYIGFSIVSVSLATTLETMHLHLVNVLVNSAISLVSTALLGVLLVVYYFDVRVRREGLDMQAQIEDLHPIVSSP